MRDDEAGGVLGARSWTPWRLLLDPLTWRSLVYLLCGLGFGLGWFVVLVVGGALGLGTAIIWVGVLLLALLMVVWRAGAMLERRVLWAAFGVRIPDPYRPMPEQLGASPAAVLRRFRQLAVDPATWKDLVYLAVLLPVTLVEFVVTLTLTAATAGLVAAPLVALAPGNGAFTIGGVPLDTFGKSLLAVPLGLVVGVFELYVLRVLAIAHSRWAVLMLGPGEKQELRHRTAQLRASRARGVDAAEAERRRIERDLHDGAQQQLLAVAMNIGRARAKLDSDPAAARALIEEAHTGARDAITELRNLARGIYPAILTDRGLDAALSALAARSPVPVRVVVDLAGRPPAAVESIAYFVVAEALVNIAKYAQAHTATVTIAEPGGRVRVEIVDDGVGGAVPTPGGGLAGLADRAATIDGTLTVHSPPGGPTRIVADLPRTW